MSGRLLDDLVRQRDYLSRVDSALNVEVSACSPSDRREALHVNMFREEPDAEGRDGDERVVAVLDVNEPYGN